MTLRAWNWMRARHAITASLAATMLLVGCADIDNEGEEDSELLQVAGATESCSDGGVTEPPRQDLGKGNGRDVITIGDSWMSLLSTGIQQSLVKASGGQRYRLYGVPGTRLLNGQIPNQYARAKRENADIKTVVMTGGGNDVLMSSGLQQDCANGGARCKEQLQKIGQALADLWAQMGRDGVKDVIHILYSSDAGRGVKDAEANNQNLRDLCANAKPVRCHILPTDDLVRGELRADGIHPSDRAYDRIGAAVYKLMEQKGIRR